MNRSSNCENIWPKMCNVIHYHFTCTHSLRRRRSNCAGTRHKSTRTSIKAACTAESFLTIYVKSDCGTCQLKQWEDDWALKLRRAEAFRDKLRGSNLPGYEAIADLVRELENRYTQESWDARQLFAPLSKRTVARVSMSDYAKAKSPLPREVKPEDVQEPDRGKEWTEMDENEYDGDYVASTDPMHPVSTDYSHPLDDDDDDGSWVLQHLADEIEDNIVGRSGEMIDFEGVGWGWGDGSGVDRNCPPLFGDLEGDSNDTITETATEYHEENGDLSAWGPHPNTPSTTTAINTPRRSERQQKQQEQIAEVVRSFWSLVNSATKSHLQTPKTASSSRLLETTLIAKPSFLDTNPAFSHPTSPPPSTPAPPTQHPPSSPTSPTPPLPLQSNIPHPPISTCPSCNKTQRTLQPRSSENAYKYYRDWLTVRRHEIRTFEGSEGRKVCDPPMLKGDSRDGVNTGWWR